MKKKYLTYIGIISAIILIGMFITVFFIKSPVMLLIPVITVDPVTDQNVDDNNFLVLTGKTNLPVQTQISTYVYPLNGSLSLYNKTEKMVARGDIWISEGNDEWNFWSGTINISSLKPSEYLVTFKTIRYVDNFTKIIESRPVTSFPFTLGNDNCTGVCIRKKDTVIKPFIRINPISEGTEYIEINGITNLVPGTPLVWKMEEKNGTKNVVPARNMGNSTVTPGIEGINRWSFLPGNKTISPGLYLITITTGTGEQIQSNSTGNVSDFMEFNYTGQRVPEVIDDERRTGAGNNTSVYFTIDTLPEMHINNKYVISGTTNLPPGELLFFQVIPYNMMQNYNFSFNPRDKSERGNFSGIAGCVDVINGKGRENFWAFEMDTYFLQPGKYEVNISNMESEPTSYQEIPGIVSYSKEFMLHGDPDEI